MRQIHTKGKMSPLVGVSRHESVRATLGFYYADDDHATVTAYASDGELIGRLYQRLDGSLLMADEPNMEPDLYLHAVPLDDIERASHDLLLMLARNGYRA